ncbi:uncharacterized protein Bfra_004747 [Botrytis fragariae]|uniref:Uncharacterized protein n=1 Tax=Botrytis fragariae TaxID=1964551 RepID=A0A8H6AW67_9HELO|nr:uncharacterized protein Bfra_004747 [Botrytis fragariae]KAF5874731.1 hypothetical protein Bfra_004747 [Botrytis fragariae]
MCPDRLFGLGDAADYLWGSLSGLYLVSNGDACQPSRSYCNIDGVNPYHILQSRNFCAIMEIRLAKVGQRHACYHVEDNYYKYLPRLH